jgi:hypothetical protein
VVAAQSAAPRRLHACLLVFYFLFALVWNVPASSYQLGFRYHYVEQDTPLGLDRGGLRVSESDANQYRQLVREVRKRTPPNGTIYATPDAAQVYFLTDRRNPTRTLYEFFDRDYGRPGRTPRLLALLEERQVDLVVLRPPGDGPSVLDPRLLEALLARYGERIDLPRFSILWRTSGERRAGER